MVTLREIAKRAGLSAATVSLVLNNRKARLPEATRQRVLALAAEMKYRPNQLAVGLVTKRTNTLGLLIPDIGNLFFSELAGGVEEAAQSAGYNVIFCDTGDDAAKDLSYIHVLCDRAVDGLVIAMASGTGREEAARLTATIEERAIPAIFVDRTPQTGSFPSVALNHRRGGYLATRHLLELGHVKIGCIMGPLRLQSAVERFEGYRQALQEANLPFHQAFVFEGDYFRESGEYGMRALLKRGVSAVFCCNDMMAYGAYQAVRERGLRIPEDISVVGFDDILFSQMLEVPLTTVRQPVRQIGREAGERLLARIGKDQQEIGAFTFEPELVVRRSTARVK